MKKIALFSLMCCLGGIYAIPAFAGSCGTTILHLDWNQDPDDDEFLYANKQAQTRAIEDYEADGEYKDNMKSGQYNLSPKSLVFECDVAQCPTRTVVYVPNDKGIVENTTGGYFRCVAIFGKNNYWFKVPECNDGEKIEDFDEDIYSVKSDTVVSKEKPKDLFKSVSKQACICGSTKEVVVEEGKKVCRTKGVKPQPNSNTKTCKEDGKTYNIGDIIEDNKDCTKLSDPLLKTGVKCQKKCYSTPTGVGAVWGIKECPKNSTPIKMSNTAASGYNPKFVLYTECHSSKPVDPVEQKTCKDKRKTQTGKACCDVPKTQAIYDEKTDKCNCLVPNAVFDIIQGKGQCVAKDATPVVEGECEYYFTGSIECANGNQYFEKAKIKLPKSEIGKECGTDILKADVTRVMEIMKTLCKPADNFVILPEDDKVKKAQEVLSAFTASAKDEASVWRTAEGNFNGSRLASDITAGVVLGTVGGVVTGNIVKKNQVKKGFEALHCTVGGQKVSDWGDEFSVGLRR